MTWRDQSLEELTPAQTKLERKRQLEAHELVRQIDAYVSTRPDGFCNASDLEILNDTRTNSVRSTRRKPNDEYQD